PVAGGAVAQARTLAQRARLPDELTRAEQDRVERAVRGRSGERADDPGSAVTPLHPELVRRTVERRWPVQKLSVAQSRAFERLDDAVHELGLVLPALQGRGAKQRVRVPRHSV